MPKTVNVCPHCGSTMSGPCEIVSVSGKKKLVWRCGQCGTQKNYYGKRLKGAALHDVP